MSKDHGQGIFTMDVIKRCDELAFGDAIVYAEMIVQQSSAKPENKAKAMKMIAHSHNRNTLLLRMSSFNLSHSGMKVIR